MKALVSKSINQKAPPQKRFFITGTDTEVGKTLVSCALLYAAGQKGLNTVGIKPVAAGCHHTPDGLRNKDALMLQQAMTENLAYDDINPIALKSAIAPHIAAQQEGKTLSVRTLMELCQPALYTPSDLTIIEGAGGWLVPLNDSETLAEFAVALRLPVILVVGLKLGCINHALLTAHAIRKSGLDLRAWVANGIDPNMQCASENTEALSTRLGSPCLGHLPYLQDANFNWASSFFDICSLGA